MIGDRSTLTLILALGSLLVSFINAYGVPLQGFLIEFIIILFSILFAVAGFNALYRRKEQLAYKYLTIFFSISLLNTVVLFYLQPNMTIIFLSVLSSTGYILVLDAIHKGKMIFDDLDLSKLDITAFRQSTEVGVLNESKEDVLKRIRSYHQSTIRDWEPRHLGDTGDVPLPQNVSVVYDAPEKKVESYKEEVPVPLPEPPKPPAEHRKPVESFKNFIAAPLSSRFHVPSCKWIERLEAKDAITFHSEQEARGKGLYPCTCVTDQP